MPPDLAIIIRKFREGRKAAISPQDPGGSLPRPRPLGLIRAVSEGSFDYRGNSSFGERPEWAPNLRIECLRESQIKGKITPGFAPPFLKGNPPPSPEARERDFS